jgi:hypothetical protein
MPSLDRKQYLWTDCSFYVGKRLFTCAFVAGAIGCARTRHSLPDGVNRLRRYFTKLFLDRGHRARCRLIAHAGRDTLFRGWSGGGFCFELSVNARLHTVDRI